MTLFGRCGRQCKEFFGEIWRSRLYKKRLTFANYGMNFDNPIVLAIAGLICLTAFGALFTTYFSTEARMERKRRRNNGKIVNQARRPTVKFSAKVDKD
jgi:hypothetical protein